jgi:hypothetical protein
LGRLRGGARLRQRSRSGGDNIRVPVANGQALTSLRQPQTRITDPLDNRLKTVQARPVVAIDSRRYALVFVAEHGSRHQHGFYRRPPSSSTASFYLLRRRYFFLLRCRRRFSCNASLLARMRCEISCHRSALPHRSCSSYNSLFGLSRDVGGEPRRSLSVDKCPFLMTYAAVLQMHRTKRQVRRWSVGHDAP